MAKEYVIGQDINYYSKRYDRKVYVPWGRESDGATWAKDLKGSIRCLRNGRPYMASLSWWVHDELCLQGMWLTVLLLTTGKLVWY